MQFKEKLEFWLVKRFDNVNKAAIALDMHPITIHNYIKGENMPGTPFLIKLCEFGCDINWLLSDKDELSNSKLIEEITLLREENDQLRKEIKKKEKKIVDAIHSVMKKK